MVRLNIDIGLGGPSGSETIPYDLPSQVLKPCVCIYLATHVRYLPRAATSIT